MNHQYQHPLAKPSPRHAASHVIFRSRSTHASSPIRRYPSIAHDSAFVPPGSATSDAEGDTTLQDDPTHVMLRERWSQTEGKIVNLFRPTASDPSAPKDNATAPANANANADLATADAPAGIKISRPRAIDDDYGDDDDDDEDDDQPSAFQQSPSLAKARPVLNAPLSRLGGQPQSNLHSALRVSTTRTSSATVEPGKNVEDVRKELEEHKNATEDLAKRSFHTMFYTFEADRHAMLEQQKLDELDRQMESEITNNQAQAAAGGAPGQKPQGSLSSADLGASSLTLKNLIARVDRHRNRVQANDTQLRSLISEVRKGRSKWASEDKVGQEELYEAAEKVLMELKAMTEYSTPFLTRVNKRDAPDYYHIIKNPMDIGTMIKKLKQLQYRSKKEFVSDLNFVWTNCLTYNADPGHPIRKKAFHMRKETDKLVPLIPDIVVRDRAEVEAEEERNHAIENGLEGGEDSEDDMPIMASRGRKAPSKGKSDSTSKPARGEQTEIVDTPTDQSKPTTSMSASNLRNGFLRADSDAGDGTPNGFGTPPPIGSSTPQTNGLHTDLDVIDVDAVASAIPTQDDVDDNDAEYITWRQVTKKDRATVAADRNRLFQNDRLNPEEPAVLRSKAGMRRWVRQQKKHDGDSHTYASGVDHDVDKSTGETLAEGIEQEEERTLPDYYDLVTAIPNLDKRLGWLDDHEGQVVPHNEQYMRIFPVDQFKAPQSVLTTRFDANLKQMQDTRKICAKVGIVKQMQIQAQTYQNQFQKYEPERFEEQDIQPLAVCEDGPVMSPWLCKAAFQRSVGKIFYHAGFEGFHPSALDAVTDLASDYFTKLASTLATYMQTPQNETKAPKFTAEEQVLHCLHRNGLELDGLEAYITDDIERMGGKLLQVHERLKSHLADLLRPALGECVGHDGEGAFNDGSEQFVGGDFAEDIDEDFFGFKELGLADELGLQALSVPLHLLQNRVHNAYAAGANGNALNSSASNLAFPPPDPYDPVTTDNIVLQLQIVQDYFGSRLVANNGRFLVEDQDLPPKQRFPKPRLGPAGKISSPRKRPLREQQQLAKKRRKMEESAAAAATAAAAAAAAGAVGAGTGGAAPGTGTNTGVAGGANRIANGLFNLKTARPMPALKLGVPGGGTTIAGGGKSSDAVVNADPEKVDLGNARASDTATGSGMISPESIAAN